MASCVRVTAAMCLVAWVASAACAEERAGPAAGADWVPDAVFYQIFPERFANGDPANDPTRESLEDEVPASWRISPWTGDWYARDAWERERAGPLESSPA